MKKTILFFAFLGMLTSISAQTNTFPSTGGVGIGTTSPFSLLSFGTANANSNSRIAFYEHSNDGSRFRGIGMANPPGMYGVGIWTGIGIPSETNMKMFIDDNGSVGIGTTNPDVKLHVKGDITSGIISTSIYGANIIEGRGAVLRLKSYGNETNSFNQWNLYSHTTNGSLHFINETNSISQIERVTFNSNGDVGIGTTNPQEKLQIEHTGSARIKLHSASVTGNSGIIFTGQRPTNNNSYHYIGTDGDGSYNLAIESDEAIFFKNNNVNTMTLHAAGRVGIGTTNPTEKLEIYQGNLKIYGDDTSRYIRFIERNLQGGFINYDGTNNILNIGVHNTSNTNVNDDYKSISILRTNGNVGIGTTNPQTPLDVNGIIKSTDGIGNTLFLSSGANGSYIRSFGNQNFGLRDTGGSSKFNFNLSSGDASFDGGLSVGDVQTPTGYKLAVGGKIITEEVKVKLQSSWPDYVFKKEYKLLSVEEVEAYIKKNGHLPKMPSAKEVEKEGVLLGEMNKKLLEKIEELTLYTIDQKKEVKKQEKRIKTQEEKMKKLEQENEQLKVLLERVAKIEKQLKAK